MEEKSNPAIVVVAFNRPNSLSRILSSLNKLRYSEKIHLIISIDNNGKNSDVLKIAEDYLWKFGTKEVIFHKKQLGLRDHIVKCGDYSEKYGSVIILEDDLLVSPYMYDYAIRSKNYYEDDKEIAGISLYNQPYTESIKLPFIPLKDNSDVYFIQVASSLGQLWTSSQWGLFKKWYDTKPEINEIVGLPMLIKAWPSTSWKKYYCAYLVLFNRYFVFPQLSLTTNFNDPGTNFSIRNHFGQTQIDCFNQQLKFKKLSESINVYDAYSELLPEKFVTLIDGFDKYKFEVDLYGKKEEITKEFALTSKKCKNPILGFEKSMKPHELNVIYNILGDDINLVRTKDIIYYPKSIKDLLFNRNTEEFIKEYNYYYNNLFGTAQLMKIIFYRIKRKFKSIF